MQSLDVDVFLILTVKIICNLDLQCYYRIKPVSPFRFTMLLQGQISLPFSIYNVITGSNQSLFSIYKVFTRSNWSPFFDLQCYYRVKLVIIFRVTRFLQGELSLPFSIFSVFTVWHDSFSFRFTGISHNI